MKRLTCGRRHQMLQQYTASNFLLLRVLHKGRLKRFERGSLRGLLSLTVVFRFARAVEPLRTVVAHVQLYPFAVQLLLHDELFVRGTHKLGDGFV